MAPKLNNRKCGDKEGGRKPLTNRAQSLDIMSGSFLHAASQRAADSTSRARPSDSALGTSWDELPGPALLSVCTHLMLEWPDTLLTLTGASEVCHGWLDALRCDAVWRAVGDAAGLVSGVCTSQAHYVALRAVHKAPPWGCA